MKTDRAFGPNRPCSRMTTSVSFYGQGTFPGHWHERVNLAHFQYEPFAQIDYIYN
jgi:hypothetical protein